MRLPIVFGKRDQAKYKEVIEWLETVEDGWKNQAVKDALLSYVQNNLSNSPSQPIPKNPTPPVVKETPKQEDYAEINISDNQQYEESNQDNDTSKLDDFLGDF